MSLFMQRLKLYRPASLADVVDLSIKYRKPCFTPHPIETGAPFDPFEKETPSAFHEIFTISNSANIF